MPSTPPAIASSATCHTTGTTPQRNSAGIVKIVPDASELDALPTVCARFVSRIVPFFGRVVKTSADSTAIGIDVDTVSPARRPRYAFAAPNNTPNPSPASTAFNVNSARRGDGGSGVAAVVPERGG